MNKNIVIAIFVLAVFNSGQCGKEYFSVLDGWVERGGRANEYQSIVLETCGKLVMVTANASEAVVFTTTQREEFDFRVDVCAKSTVNRFHHRPEFGDPKLIRAICDNSKVI